MQDLQNERRYIVNHVFRPQINYDESFVVNLKIERPNPCEMHYMLQTAPSPSMTDHQLIYWATPN